MDTGEGALKDADLCSGAPTMPQPSPIFGFGLASQASSVGGKVGGLVGDGGCRRASTTLRAGEAAE